MVMRVFQTRPIICCFLSRYPFVSSFLHVARCTLDPFLQASVGRFIFTFSAFSWLSFFRGSRHVSSLSYQIGVFIIIGDREWSWLIALLPPSRISRSLLLFLLMSHISFLNSGLVFEILRNFFFFCFMLGSFLHSCLAWVGVLENQALSIHRLFSKNFLLVKSILLLSCAINLACQIVTLESWNDCTINHL